MGRTRILLVLVAAGITVAVAVPVIAYVVVPVFVKRTLVEAMPAIETGALATAPSDSPGTTTRPAGPRVLAQGALRHVDSQHYGTGQVAILDTGSARVLRFDRVSIAGAPDMYVYLSESADGRPGHFTDLGRLKATDGSFNYEIPAGLDLSTVRSLVVWCRAFTVTVTWALLNPA